MVECNGALSSEDGAPTYLTLDMKAKLHIATMAPSYGVTERDIEEATEVKDAMERQNRVRAQLHTAQQTENIDLLKSAIEEAHATNHCVQLAEFKKADKMLHKLDPGFFDQVPLDPGFFDQVPNNRFNHMSQSYA